MRILDFFCILAPSSLRIWRRSHPPPPVEATGTHPGRRSPATRSGLRATPATHSCATAGLASRVSTSAAERRRRPPGSGRSCCGLLSGRPPTPIVIIAANGQPLPRVGLWATPASAVGLLVVGVRRCGCSPPDARCK